MKMTDIIRDIADLIDQKMSQGGTDDIGRSIGSDSGDALDNKTMRRMQSVPEPEQDTGDDDKMVPPLQQKHELLKKVAGVDNEYDREEEAGCGEADEIARMKKMAGIVIAGDENDIN